MHVNPYNAASLESASWGTDSGLIRAVYGVIDQSPDLLALLRHADKVDRLDRDHLDEACRHLGRELLAAVTEWIEQDAQATVARNFSHREAA